MGEDINSSNFGKKKKKKSNKKLLERSNFERTYTFELTEVVTHFSLSILQDGVFAIPVVTFVFGVCMRVSSSRCLLVVHDS